METRHRSFHFSAAAVMIMSRCPDAPPLISLLSRSHQLGDHCPMVALQALSAPQMEYAHAEKGEALNAMEISHVLQQKNYKALVALQNTATRYGDPSLCDFIVSKLLPTQVRS